MIAILAAVLLSQLPSPPTQWTREDIERRWGPSSFEGPLSPPWAEGSVVASYVQRLDELDGLCRHKAASVKGARWIALVYYAPDGRMVSTHCLQLGELGTGWDVTPDVTRRLQGRRT